MKKLLFVLCLMPSVAVSGELVHQFSSPAFSGNGYSTHVLTIDQLERQRDKENRDEAQAALDKAERERKSTNLYKFQNNLESRIYAQLSKQIADSLFGETELWSEALPYNSGDIVKLDNKRWLSLSDNNSSRPSTDNTDWREYTSEWSENITPFGDTIKWKREDGTIYVEIYDSNGDLASEFQTPVGDFAF